MMPGNPHLGLATKVAQLLEGCLYTTTRDLVYHQMMQFLIENPHFNPSRANADSI
jgi:hypothetical protein